MVEKDQYSEYLLIKSNETKLFVVEGESIAKTTMIKTDIEE